VEKNQQFVTIKGTKDGLSLFLNDDCSFRSLLQEIEEKLTFHQDDTDIQGLIKVHLKIGNRYLPKEREEEICSLIQKKGNFVVESFDCNVISKEQALEWKNNSKITSVVQTVRSGQILEIKGDLLLIGDVNPGASVVAEGNIYILGALKGIAHAGSNGNDEAVIVASVMQPMQLRISGVMNRAPDENSYIDDVSEMECAYIDQGHVVIDRMQVLNKIRPNITCL
jgi:septum site-determining protein MinC